MTTVIVEPHADDAWLSVGQHLLDRAFGPVVILTVYGSERRMREAERYATGPAGGRWRGLGLPESGLGNAVDWTTDPPPGLADAVASFEPTRVIGPLGLHNPEHLAVRAALDAAYGSELDLYVEYPYALVRRNADALSGALDATSRSLVSARVRTAAANASAHIFASQSQFWHYNRESMVKALELVLGDRNR